MTVTVSGLGASIRIEERSLPFGVMASERSPPDRLGEPADCGRGWHEPLTDRRSEQSARGP